MKDILLPNLERKSEVKKKELMEGFNECGRRLRLMVSFCCVATLVVESSACPKSTPCLAQASA